jgi:hypothetical protein
MLIVLFKAVTRYKITPDCLESVEIIAKRILRENISFRTLRENVSFRILRENVSFRTLRENVSFRTLRENVSVRTLRENVSFRAWNIPTSQFESWQSRRRLSVLTLFSFSTDSIFRLYEYFVCQLMTVCADPSPCICYACVVLLHQPLKQGMGSYRCKPLGWQPLYWFVWQQQTKRNDKGSILLPCQFQLTERYSRVQFCHH